jgi:Domain of unknown function (DUF932)
MMKGLTLSQLAAKIEGNRALKQDFITSTDALSMAVMEDHKPVLAVPGQGTFPLLPLAHDQIGGRLGIPSKYYDRMLKEEPRLLVSNVNTWFSKTPEKRMVRTLGGDVRAFLSNRYQRVENEEIANVALPILADIPDVKIVSSEITERRMYIQAVAPRVQGEVKRGDVIQAGVVISNSEVGCGSVSVAAMDWRLICLNGAIAADKFRAYHVGRRIEDNAELWASDTLKADDRAVLLKVRDMVKAAVDATRFQARLEKMADLTTVQVTGDPAKAVEVLANKIGVTEMERGGILRSLIEGGDLSAWGLLNAVTAQAHTAHTYDRAVEFEAAGGQLIELPRNQWKEVLEAA